MPNSLPNISFFVSAVTPPRVGVSFLSITQQGKTNTRKKRIRTAGESVIKTSRPVNVTTKTGYNNMNKEDTCMI
jgi:hypothetical protein